MLKKLQMALHHPYFPFFLWFCFLCLWHILLPLQYGDDVNFATVLAQTQTPFQTAWEFLTHRYQVWTSRLVIESILIFIIRVPVVWHVMDIALMTWIAFALSMFFNPQNKKSGNWMIFSLLLLFPLSMMGTAGYITTTMNYAWPIAFGWISLIPLYHMLHQKKTHIVWYIISLLSMLYAVNHEQTCALLFAVYFIFLIDFYLRTHNVKWFLLLQILVSVASLIFILTCPGNDVRFASEVQYWFPEFSSLSFFQKVEMGYSATLFELIMKPNWLFTALCAVIAFMVFHFCKTALPRWIAASAFGLSIVMGLCGDSFSILFPSLLNLRNALTIYGTNPSLTSPFTWVPDLFLLFVCICVFIGIWFAFERKETALFCMYVIGAGFATRLVIGFSPTIWASSTRTFCCLYFCLIAAILLLWQEAQKRIARKHLAWIQHTTLACAMLYAADFICVYLPFP